MRLTQDLIDRAAALARTAHADQTRKGTGASYFDGHLEPVARLVAGAGGSDVQIAAAYLHDAAEDAGGAEMLRRIQREFGSEVAAIVGHLSDSLVDTGSGAAKADWATRKRRYVADLAAAPVDALLVAVADKLHNARSILDDYDEMGPTLWSRFNESRPQFQLWYYTTLDTLFRRRLADSRLTGQLTRCLTALIDRVRSDVPNIDTLVAEVTVAHAEDLDRGPA